MLNIKFAGGSQPVNNPSTHNVEGDKRLLPSLQPLSTGSVMQMYFFSPVPGIVFFIQKPPGYKPPGQKPPDKKPPNNELYKLFIYWYLCTHFRLIVLLFMS